jgi:hypothetical protein
VAGTCVQRVAGGGILGFVHYAHPAATQFLQDAVMGYQCAYHEKSAVEYTMVGGTLRGGYELP